MKISELITKLKTLESLYGDLSVETDCADYPSVVSDICPYSEKEADKLKVKYYMLYSRMKGPGE